MSLSVGGDFVGFTRTGIISPFTLPAPSQLGSNFLTYLSQPGGIVVIPNGTYNVGTGTLSNQTHTGTPLTLVAETLGGVTVDGTKAGIAGTLQLTNVNNVNLVGINITMVTTTFTGCTNWNCWYSDYSNPDYSVLPSDSSHIPRFTRYFSGTDNINWYGGAFHDGNASAFFISSFVGKVHLQGIQMYNIFEHPGTDPGNVVHLDMTGQLHGPTGPVEVWDLNISGVGRCNIQTSPTLNGTNSGNQQISWKRTWYTQATGVAFQFHCDATSLISGDRTDVYSWNHQGANIDRQDWVDGTKTSTDGNPATYNAIPSRVNVVDTNVHTTAPIGADPATVWQQANPRSSWPTFFGFT